MTTEGVGHLPDPFKETEFINSGNFISIGFWFEKSSSKSRILLGPKFPYHEETSITRGCQSQPFLETLLIDQQAKAGLL